MMGQLRNKEGKFAGWEGTPKKDLPSSQDPVVKKHAEVVPSDDSSFSAPPVDSVFSAYTKLSDTTPSSLRTVDTSRFGEYEPTSEDFDNWRAADGLMIRWERGAFGRDIITAELDIPELDHYYSSHDVRSLIREDKASEATKVLAAHLRRMADELEDKSFDLYLEEQQRHPDDEYDN